MKSLIMAILRLPDKMANAFILKYRHIVHGENLTINGKLKVYGHGEISLGNHVTINSSASSNPIGGDTRTTFSIVPGAKLTIGNRTGISNATIVCHEQVIIEDGVQIGGSVKIYDTNFHSLDEEKRDGADMALAQKRPVHIKENAFIGAHSIILKGVTIGKGSIIGAGSVVTKDVPDGEVWGGNPAKCIRGRKE